MMAKIGKIDVFIQNLFKWIVKTLENEELPANVSY